MNSTTAIYISFILSLLFSIGIRAQNTPGYRSPLDIPLALSGTFGELRSNHFHSGIDIRTQGKTGLPIYAIASGYVSRIAVGAFGFGNAVYIHHPETGHTSVYAHLESFNDEITAYIRKVQYQKQSFEVNVYLDPQEILVQRGEVIAKSGNSGSSGGPHLHFEIRRTSDQKPLNPLLFGFEVEDESAPVINRIKFFPVDQHGAILDFDSPEGYAVNRIAEGEYRFDREVLVLGQVGVALDVYDRQEGSWNKNGVYGTELYVDDQLFFRQVFDDFSFAETRYCNATTNYEAYVCCRKKFYNGVRLPNNKLAMLKGMPSHLDFEPGEHHQLRFEVYDLAGNRSKLTFEMTGDHRLANRFRPEDPASWMPYNQTNAFRNEHIDLFLPLDVLYEDVFFEYTYQSSDNALSDVHEINNSKIAAHSRFMLGIRPKHTNFNEKKLFIARVGAGGGHFALEKASFKGDYAYAKVRSFGSYQLVLDTISPEIQPINFWAGQHLGKRTHLQFKAMDELSGIRDYRVEINGRWVLAEYDGKNDLFTIDVSEFIAPGEQKIVFRVTDEAGNEALWEGSVFQ
jgi:hypothetical protein